MPRALSPAQLPPPGQRTPKARSWRLITKTRNRVNQATLHQQWLCHALGKFVIFFEPPPNNTWDLEGWRRVVANPLDFIWYRCNW
ncbi:DUF2599 domain-containing protein [Arthrobacter sp. NPDC058127]|uniref:DUF2599 domain-containing protein n=1 Tax=Arthrobacter sp. NPDC058127 TaxID=3346351 RepID=UPI0036EE67BC